MNSADYSQQVFDIITTYGMSSDEAEAALKTFEDAIDEHMAQGLRAELVADIIVNDYFGDDEDDEYYDDEYDGQPSEFEEWQDVYGGDVSEYGTYGDYDNGEW